MGDIFGETTTDAPSPPAEVSMEEKGRQFREQQRLNVEEQFRLQEEFGDQFSQQQLESLRQFGPEFAETAAQLQQDFARTATPELQGAQQTLKDFFGRTDEEEFANLLPGLLQDVRGAQSVRGFGDISPLGSIDESVQVQKLKQSLKDRRLGLAQGVAGRVPIATASNAIGQTGVGQLGANVNPETIFGSLAGIDAFNQSIFGTQANIFGVKQGALSRESEASKNMVPSVNYGISSSPSSTGETGTNDGTELGGKS